MVCLWSDALRLAPRCSLHRIACTKGPYDAHLFENHFSVSTCLVRHAKEIRRTFCNHLNICFVLKKKRSTWSKLTMLCECSKRFKIAPLVAWVMREIAYRFIVAPSKVFFYQEFFFKFINRLSVVFQCGRVEETVNQKNRTDENLRKKEKELYEIKNR